MSLHEGEKGTVLMRTRKHLWKRSQLRRPPGIRIFTLPLLPSTFGPGGNVLPMSGLQCGSHMLDTVGSIWLQQTHCRSQLSPSAKHTYEKAKRSSVAVREECEKQLCRHQSERRRGTRCSRVQSGGSPGRAVAVIHTATHRGPHTGPGRYLLKETANCGDSVLEHIYSKDCSPW